MITFQKKLAPKGMSVVSFLLCTMFVLFASSIEASAVSPNWTGTGENVSDQYGASVSSAGDVNGDGYSDVIVGAPGYNNGNGRVFVYLGSPSGLSATPNITLTGEAGVYTFGASVSSAGDVNGDGYSDVIVGAPGYNTNTGRVYVYLGSPSGLMTSPAITLEGEAAWDFFGASVSSAGDVNGDGYSDIIVGANRHQVNVGRAFVYLGSSSGLNASPATTLTGEAAVDAFGLSVSSAGDVNGDGYSDVIVGAPSYNYGQGKVYVYLGSPSGISATPDITLTGEHSYDYFGASVSSAGDVNGDGYSDVIVGAFNDHSDYNKWGKVYVYLGSPSGLSASPAITLGETETHYYGNVISSAGDVNGDGYSDVIVGDRSYYYTLGRAYLYLGSPSGLGAIPAVTLTEEASSETFGAALSSADVNGDGYTDIILGDSAYSNNTGRAYVYKAFAWKPEYLPLIPGTVWQYQINGQDKVSRKVLSKKVNVNGVDTNAVQYVEEKITAYFTNDSDGILLHGQYQPHVYVQGVGWVNIDATFNPPVRFSGINMGIGGSFHSQGVARTKVAGQTFDFNYTADTTITTIEAMENITVPAGNFDTIKVNVSLTLSSPYGDFTTSQTLYLAEGIGIVKDISTDTQGVISAAELVYTNAGIYDLAITSIKQPKKVTLSSATPSKTSLLKVQIQNNGSYPETIEDATMLTNLITLTVESLGSCPTPRSTLHSGKPQKPLPITVEPGKRLTVYYDVTFDCANDPAKNIPDYRFKAVVNHAALDGKTDSNPLDDVCPRSITAQNDKGCGAKKPDGTIGGDLLADVVVK